MHQLLQFITGFLFHVNTEHMPLLVALTGILCIAQVALIHLILMNTLHMRLEIGCTAVILAALITRMSQTLVHCSEMPL